MSPKKPTLELQSHPLDGLTRDQLAEWHTIRSRFELQALWNNVHPTILETGPVMEIGTSSIGETAQRSAEHWAHWGLKFDAERVRQFFRLKAIDHDLANAVESSVFDLWEMSRDIRLIKGALPFLAAFIYSHPAFKDFVGTHEDPGDADPMLSHHDMHG